MKPKQSAKKQANKQNQNELPKWNDVNQKKKVFLAIMNDIAEDPGAFVGKDDAAKCAFKHKIEVPDNVRIIVLPYGEAAIKGGGSMVIQAPPQGSNLNEKQKLELFLCSYPIGW
jgi:hypothetical protein